MGKFLKGEKGSITILVLTTMLVVVSVMFMAYFSNMNKILAQEKEINKIQEEYMQGSANEVMEQAYGETMEDYKPKLVRNWVNKIDGNGEEEFLDVEKTSDDGYIAVGYTTSTNISGLTNKGSADCLIAKYDANGNEEWKKSVGGSKNDRYSGVIEITNGTYIAVGTIYSTDVVDKNGNNIGYGYDWSINFEGIDYNMVATEGIIGKYDENGNEIFLRTTGKATNTYNGKDYGDGIFDLSSVSSININIYGIDKVSGNNFIITGKRRIGVPSTSAISLINEGHLVIKYNQNGDEIAESEFMKFETIYANNVEEYRSWKGVIEKENGSYVLFGTSGSRCRRYRFMES